MQVRTCRCGLATSRTSQLGPSSLHRDSFKTPLLANMLRGSSMAPSRLLRAGGICLQRAMITRQVSAPSASSASNATRAQTPRVCVVGGGFGGLYTAIRLESLLWPRGTKPQITLVDQNDRFVFKPLLYEFINGTAGAQEVAPLYSELLASYAITFVQAKVSSIKPSSEADAPNQGVVKLSDGSELEYDYLVVALGAASNTRGIPGVQELAVPFNSLDDAMRVKAAVDSIVAGHVSGTSAVVIVGAGYAGVELATVVAERLNGKAAVQLVTPGPDIMPGSPDGQRDAAHKALAAAGVEILTGVKVKGLVRSPSTGASSRHSVLPTCTVQLDYSGDLLAPAEASTSYGYGATNGPSITADLVVWTAGSSPATPHARKGFPFPTNARGGVQTDRMLRVVGHPAVFAVGDVSETGSAPTQPEGGTATERRQQQAQAESSAVPNTATPQQQKSAAFPHTAQVAFQQADYVAWNIWSSINKRPLLPFRLYTFPGSPPEAAVEPRYQHLGSMMSLGQLNGAVALPFPVPPPLKSLVEGSPLSSLLGMAGVSLSSTDPDNPVTLEGPLAALARRAAYLYRQPTNEQRISVAASWLQQAAGLAGRLGGKGRSSQPR